MKTYVPTLSFVSILCVSVAAADPELTPVDQGELVAESGHFQGCAWGDYDNDGDLDLFVCRFNDPHNSLYRNEGDGSFAKVSSGIIVSDTRGYSVSAAWGDYDNDGFLDLFIANGTTDFPRDNYLYHNEGDGSFTKVTTGRIVRDGGKNFGCAWADYDNDGLLDLFVANAAGGGRNYLYHNEGDGDFSRAVSSAVEQDPSDASGGSWGDYDSDGDVDLFVTNFRAYGDRLYRNDGNGVLVKVTEGPIVNDEGDGVGSAWGDYDNDGDLDLFVCNLNQNNFLYRNDGNESFSLITEGQIANDGGASIGCAWGDYDNDGDLDLFVTNEFYQDDFLYENLGAAAFRKVTSGPAVSSGGHSLGCGWADYNNDGQLDLFVANGGDANLTEKNFLYRNAGSGNNWINIRCRGTVSNRGAIGAKVRVKAVIAGAPRWQMREVSGGGGFSCQDSLNAEFGLGDAVRAEAIRVEWPSGLVQELYEVDLNQFLTVSESIQFHRGDPNSSGSTDISDGIIIFGFLFLGDMAISCKESADANNDATIDISDGIYLLNWLFGGGPEPVAPGPATEPCGFDADPPGSPGDLGCKSYSCN